MSHANPLPREIAPGIHWIGDCIPYEYQGEALHSYSSSYLVTGGDASLIVDTGHPKDWPVISGQIDTLLARGVPPVRYLFPTHVEVAHAANVVRLATKLPDTVVVTDVRDYHLYFPEIEGRLRPARAGDTIDLGGGTTFELLPAVIRDLRHSLWGYDRDRRVLFPGDGFAYMHAHAADQCGRLAEEVPSLDYQRMAFTIAQFALHWTLYTDVQGHIDDLMELLREHPADLIAPGHGLPLGDPETTIPKVLDGLRVREGAA